MQHAAKERERDERLDRLEGIERVRTAKDENRATTTPVAPLTPDQLALAEVVEMVAAGRAPGEIRALGWENAANLQEQRRREILETEVALAPSLGVPD